MTKTEKKLIPGTRDYMFKALLLSPKTRDYLRWIIHLVTNIPLEKLKNIIVQNVEHIVKNKKDKKMRSDIIVGISDHIINLEMNNKNYKNIFNKNDGYLSKIESGLYDESNDYSNIKQVIQINFNNFSIFDENKEIYKFVYKEYDSNLELPNSSIKYHIDLAYIRKTCYNKDVLLLSKFEKYTLLLLAETDKFADRIAGDDDILKKVSEELNILSKSKKILGLYDADIEAEKVMRTRLKDAKEEGLEQGLEQGIQQGQTNKAIEIAQKMLLKNIDLNIISEVTGLTIDELSKLKDA